MNTFGDKTKPNVFENVESHKLMLAFTAAADIKAGMPVKLTTAGLITPLLAADDAYLKLGDSIHTIKSGEEATVVMKGHIALLMVAAGAVDAGPAKYSAFNNTEKKPTYVAAANAATSQGFILEPASAAGEEVTVVLI